MANIIIDDSILLGIAKQQAYRELEARGGRRWVIEQAQVRDVSESLSGLEFRADLSATLMPEDFDPMDTTTEWNIENRNIIVLFAPSGVEVIL